MAYKYIYNGIFPQSLYDENPGVHPIILNILYNRGIRTPEEIQAFLHPSTDAFTGKFYALDLDVALDALESVVQKQGTVSVYRDFDCDGICAGAIACSALRHLGVKAKSYANSRSEGYGMSRDGIDHIMADAPDTAIILTVDVGIAAADAISYAKEKYGISTIVTDHHLAPVKDGKEVLPDAIATIDLHREGETYPMQDYCGAGLIFRIMLELYRRVGADESFVMSLCDIAALATVADVVSLRSVEHRALVREGIRLMEEGTRPFFRLLYNELNLTSKIEGHNTLGFKYAPCVNALNRLNLDTANAVEALISSDEGTVARTVSSMVQANEARKNITEQFWDSLKATLDPDHPDYAYTCYSPQFQEGMVGLLAGKVKELCNRPAVVFADVGNGLLKGSGRSIDGFSLKTALDEINKEGLLVRYGGHPKAAGLTIKREDLDAFRTSFQKIAEEWLRGKDLRTPLEIIYAFTDPAEITPELIHLIRDTFDPIGEGFDELYFGLTAPSEAAEGPLFIGKDKNHVKYKVGKLDVLYWFAEPQVRECGNPIPKKFVGTLSTNEWNGMETAQMFGLWLYNKRCG